MRFILACVLSAGVVFGFGSGFASLAGWHHEGWDSGGCPHREPTP